MASGSRSGVGGGGGDGAGRGRGARLRQRGAHRAGRLCHRAARHRRVDHRAQAVDGAEHRVGNARLHFEPAVAQLVEQLLELVHDLRDLGEADHGGAALQRVGVAEHLRDELGVGPLALELHRPVRQRAEPPLRLAREQLPELVLVAGGRHAGAPLAATASASPSSSVTTSSSTA